MTEERLKLAVFIDFDNIEIGVRNTLGRNLDIAAVLEAIKERGEIVTKVAYGDWKRSGDYGRTMGQHAIQMVQRNPTPGGDKNGADINLALDALEMAFTRDHINAFVIVGGDSDFITLVEKLKQYDKKVMVVGGRAFTSIILQKNCHEFIAYENLIRSVRRASGRSRSVSETPIEKAIPLVRRSLKILTDREVSPQLGLLKSTLLQLDSTFSERDYGATTFRDFIEKLARKGILSLKHEDRSILVEDRNDDEAADVDSGSKDARDVEPVSKNGARIDEGVRVIRSVFDKATEPLKWPMYLRGFKQFIKASEPDFDEKSFGFTSLLDALRHTQKAGVLRLERNRQGVLRIFPGELITQSQPTIPPSETERAAESASEDLQQELQPEPTEALGSQEQEEPVAVTEPQGSEEAEPSKARPRRTAAKKTTRKTSKKTMRKETTEASGKSTKKVARKKTTKATSRKTSKKPADPDSDSPT